jgi:hypothetical protein
MTDQRGDSAGDAADGTADQEPAEGSDKSASMAYRGVMITVIGLGCLAVFAGFAGTFIALTGGLDGGEEYDALGAFACESFEGDPEVVPETEYAIEREVLTPTEVATFNGTVDGETMRVTLETTGPLLAATANQPDGRVIPVQTEEDTLTVAQNSTEPFRLWVDAVGEEGTVTRMRLDICPPQS